MARGGYVRAEQAVTEQAEDVREVGAHPGPERVAARLTSRYERVTLAQPRWSNTASRPSVANSRTRAARCAEGASQIDRGRGEQCYRRIGVSPFAHGSRIILPLTVRDSARVSAAATSSRGNLAAIFAFRLPSASSVNTCQRTSSSSLRNRAFRRVCPAYTS